MGIEYFDKDGNPIGMDDYLRLTYDKDYRRVGWTKVKEHVVSTVWLGLDHSYGGPKPVIFETMVFSNEDNLVDLDCQRYVTLEEAYIGHITMVYKWALGLSDES